MMGMKAESSCRGSICVVEKLDCERMIFQCFASHTSIHSCGSEEQILWHSYEAF